MLNLMGVKDTIMKTFYPMVDEDGVAVSQPKGKVIGRPASLEGNPDAPMADVRRYLLETRGKIDGGAIAKEVGVSAATVYTYLSGQPRCANPKTMSRIADAAGMNMGYKFTPKVA